jgi:hypothetical protein
MENTENANARTDVTNFALFLIRNPICFNFIPFCSYYFHTPNLKPFRRTVSPPRVKRSLVFYGIPAQKMPPCSGGHWKSCARPSI